MILKNTKKIIFILIFTIFFIAPSFASAETVTVTASPTTIPPGGTSTISWNYSAGNGTCIVNTDSNSTTGHQGTYAGSYEMSIQDTSTIFVRCGSDVGYVVVNVVPVSVAASPSQITSGESSKISWITPPGLQCDLYDNKSGIIKSSLTTSGNITVKNIATNILYTIKCTDSSNNNYTDTATVDVQSPNTTPPITVTTLLPTNITDASATGNGTVSGNGITEKGIVWGINPNPRTWDYGGQNKVVLPGGPGDISVPFTHNSPNTKIHIRVYAIVPGTTNGADADHWYGQDLVFSTSSENVLTGDAINITDTEAVLTGSVNPQGTTTSGYFRYSTMEIPPVFCNDIYGSDMVSTWEEKLGSGTSPMTFSTKISGLDSATTYYFCTVSSNPGEIKYGGVKSFTTLGIPGSLSVTTNGALVENTTSAYLNGSFVSGTNSSTWFEYRKFNLDNPTTWIHVNQESHKQGDTGKLSYELKSLSPGTQYEFRAAITDNSVTEIPRGSFAERIFNSILGIEKVFAANPKTSPIIYGDKLTFKTQDDNNIKPGPVGNGVPYTNPCDNPDDGNCNGTGGTHPGGGTLRPDLIAGRATPAYGKVSTPITLMALIRNQGKASTLTSFYNFFQISLVNPINSSGNTTSGTTSFNNLLSINKALAATDSSGTSNPNILNLPAIMMPTLTGGGSATTIQTYTFATVGTYYIRACADKNSPNNSGAIVESNEGNNCGPWASIVISLDGTSGGGGGGGTGGGTGSGTGTTPSPLTLGQTATPPVDAVVHYHEGIETVLQRQIVADVALAKTYGYKDGADLNSFAWYLADLFARTFGYVSPSGKEIRVALPDIAAYQIEFVGGTLTIYEYYDSKIVNIQKMTQDLRDIYEYEYYFRKK